MALTKTDTLQRISVVMAEPADKSTIIVSSLLTWDDPDDDQLPIERENVKHILKYSTEYDEDQIPTINENDISGEPQIVQDIAALVWSMDD